jgi:hypothetical protein
MKKILYILPLLLLWGCTPDLLEVEPYSEIHMDIFEVQNTVVSDGDEFFINFESNGEYVLSLVDEFTNITYTNEKIEGKAGSNSLRIYTRALPKGSYNFLVKDNQDNIIKQTTIKL